MSATVVPIELLRASDDTLLDTLLRLTHMVHATDSNDLRTQRDMIRTEIVRRMAA